MKPEQQLAPQQELKQERSFSEICVPQLMGLANQNKHTVGLLVQDLPQEWQFSDRVLVAVFPTFRDDVEEFYRGNGKSMTDMFQPHQLDSIDNGARLTLLRKLAEQHQRPSGD